jgi:hypothetical protein
MAYEQLFITIQYETQIQLKEAYITYAGGCTAYSYENQ